MICVVVGGRVFYLLFWYGKKRTISCKLYKTRIFSRDVKGKDFLSMMSNCVNHIIWFICLKRKIRSIWSGKWQGFGGPYWNLPECPLHSGGVGGIASTGHLKLLLKLTVTNSGTESPQKWSQFYILLELICYSVINNAKTSYHYSTARMYGNLYSQVAHQNLTLSSSFMLMISSRVIICFYSLFFVSCIWRYLDNVNKSLIHQ